jgi:hypothetical protein
VTTPLSDEEWKAVQEALVVGGLQACINDILASRFRERCPVLISDTNRRIIEQAYDDGEGNGITLVPTDDCPWFAGMYDGSEMMVGLEHNGTLYSIVTLSGGGLVAVIVGRGLIDNEIGVAFHGFVEAKAYVKGLTAK